MTEPPQEAAERILTLLHDGIVAISRLSEVEVASALGRRCREGAFPAEELYRALAALRRDVGTLFVVELTGEIVARAVTLLSRLPLRSADAVQLASCLELCDRMQVPCVFVSGDERLASAARQEGLVTAP